MLAFEISINGHRVQTIANGAVGSLSAGAMWCRIPASGNTVHEELRTFSNGIEGSSNDTVGWPHFPLKIGDEVVVRIVEVEGRLDQPVNRFALKDEAHCKRQH